jgi:hypothetical protein
VEDGTCILQGKNVYTLYIRDDIGYTKPTGSQSFNFTGKKHVYDYHHIETVQFILCQCKPIILSQVGLFVISKFGLDQLWMGRIKTRVKSVQQSSLLRVSAASRVRDVCGGR